MKTTPEDAFADTLERRMAGRGDSSGDDPPHRLPPSGADSDLATMLAVTDALQRHRPVLDQTSRARMRSAVTGAAVARPPLESVPGGRRALALLGVGAALAVMAVAGRSLVTAPSRSGLPAVDGSGSGRLAARVASTAVSRRVVVDLRRTEVPPSAAPPELSAPETAPPTGADVVVVVLPGPTDSVAAHEEAGPAPIQAPVSGPREDRRRPSPSAMASAAPTAAVTATATAGACGSAVIAGTVRDPLGRPAIGALVTALRVRHPLERYEMAAGADGTYRLERLCPGRYALSAVLSGPVSLAGSYDPDHDGVADTVDLTADSPTAAGIDIDLCEVVPVRH